MSVITTPDTQPTTTEKDSEKLTHIDDHLENSNSSQVETATEAPDEVDEKRLIRKIDFTVIPWLTFLNILCLLDRVGISNARLYEMEAALGLSDTQYLIALTIFFVPYALFEVPANLCLKRIRPSIWLSSLVLLWGVSTMCIGFVKNFAGLLSLRLLVGVFQAGFQPGAILYLSCWYKRDELGLRFAFFNSSLAIAGAFGGLLGAAIANIDGVAGKPAWTWIFIIEGLVTAVAGVASYFLVQDFPDTARFLSERERSFVVSRLRKANQFSATGEKLRWKDIRESLTDYKTWLGAMCLTGFRGPSLPLLLPSIIRQLGYAATRSNLLTVPVYMVACVIACCIGYLADRLKRRGYICIILVSLVGASYIILLCSRLASLSYFATYTAAFGIFSGNPNFIAWFSNNVQGSHKRAVSIAMIYMCANLIAIVGPNTYRERDTPWYTLGHAVTLGYAVIGLVGSVAMFVLLRRENTRRDRGERDEVVGDSKDGDPRNGCYGSVEDAKRDKGDEWSGFRYII